MDTSKVVNIIRSDPTAVVSSDHSYEDRYGDFNDSLSNLNDSLPMPTFSGSCQCFSNGGDTQQHQFCELDTLRAHNI